MQTSPAMSNGPIIRANEAGGPIMSWNEVAWGPGYSQDELDDAQERFGLHFPPDLIDLLLERRLPGGWDWSKDRDRITEMLAWPLDGLLWDVENAGLWWPEWGPRPLTQDGRAEMVGRIVAAAPKLIPLYGHRFIPEEPSERGNPVFSVHQSDIIYYGSDLANYVIREFVDRRPSAPLREPIRRIRFWSDTVDRAFDEACYTDPPG
jgi:hypothetical protein